VDACAPRSRPRSYFFRDVPLRPAFRTRPREAPFLRAPPARAFRAPPLRPAFFRPAVLRAAFFRPAVFRAALFFRRPPAGFFFEELRLAVFRLRAAGAEPAPAPVSEVIGGADGGTGVVPESIGSGDPVGV